MDTPHASRRQFLAAGAGLAAAGALAGAAPSFSPWGRHRGHRSDEINIAVLGIRGRGNEHIQAFARMDGVRVAALVDPDSRLFAERALKVEALQGSAPAAHQDLRRVLDDPSIDAISIATPTTGTRSPPSGAARPASMCMSRSPAATRSPRGGSW
jgi:hypothetical protein